MNAAKPLGEISEFGRKERIRMQQGRSVKILNLEDKNFEGKNECCKVVQRKF